MREQFLSGFGSPVGYPSNKGGAWLTRLNAKLQASTVPSVHWARYTAIFRL